MEVDARGHWAEQTGDDQSASRRSAPFPKCGSAQPLAFPDSPPSPRLRNPGGSDVRRMWVVPPGPGLRWSKFKGADHVEGCASCSPAQAASPQFWVFCRKTGREKVEEIAGVGYGKRARENQCCLRRPASEPLPTKNRCT